MLRALAIRALHRLQDSEVIDRERGEFQVVATLAGGKRLEASLLVGAEGRTSPTRDDAGISVAKWEYRHRAIVTVLRHAVNLGVGAALQTGFRVAVEHGFDVAVQFDADGQHPADALEAVVGPVLAGEVDVCFGSRFVTRSGYHAPFSRRAGMILFSALVSVTLGRRIADTTSGFRAYGRAVMETGAGRGLTGPRIAPDGARSKPGLTPGSASPMRDGGASVLPSVR